LGYSDGGALPAAPAEAYAIAQLLAGRVWVEDEATSERLRRVGAHCAVLHLAAHGVLRLDNPNASFIQLADGPCHPSDVLTLDLGGCRLVTLSACRTGLGRMSGGDEQIGLATAFARAGAEAVLSTLWRIDDAATLVFMRVLYHHVAAGLAPARALREAQLASLRHSDTPFLAHPYFWGGFQLTTHRLRPEATAARV
jgi:CHAT domain-containing protein